MNDELWMIFFLVQKNSISDWFRGQVLFLTLSEYLK